MNLSLCLIARNEEQNLPRALGSFAGLCDEIIVADTGSTDQTIEVARKFGAHVVNFQWCDDFAAARNFCLQHARCEWVFWLDADEELLPESVAAVQSCIARADVAGWFVLRQDLTRSDRTDIFTEMMQLRLFRRDDQLRFRGRCHPDFDPPLFELARARGLTVKPSSIRLRHWGYIAEIKPAKLHRAARLLRLELADRPGQLYYEIEYGRTLLALGEKIEGRRVLEVATERLLQHRGDPAPPTSMAVALLEYLIVMNPGEWKCSISRDQLFALCHRWFPRSAPLLWAMSKCLFEASQFPEAAGLLETLVQLGRTDTYDKSVSFDPRIVREDAALNLAACYIRLAELDKAEQVLRTLLTSSRGNEAEQNLAAIARLRMQ